MNNGRIMRRLLSIILVLTLALMSIADETPIRVKAEVSTKKLESMYLNATEKYLSLGVQGSNTYDFNIKKAAMKNVASYSWYVKTDKGDPNSVTINSKTGVVTAKKVGTAYIICKITLANGKILRSEAKVIVINNITKVEISNISTNTTITVGKAIDFNRNVLNTTAGKGKKTQGITRWEILNDTAGVDTATDWGVVLPTKAGKFKIRAVCFQSNAKYKQWLADKQKNAGNITAASKWATINVASSNGTAIAAEKDQLIKLLAADNITQITISTKEALKFTIPKGDYSQKNLIINAPNVDVENHGIFKKITMNDFKNGKWSEFSKVNIFHIMGNQTHMFVDKTATIDEVIVDSFDAIANFKVDGKIFKITIKNRAQLKIFGSGGIIPVTLEEPSAGSTVTTSLPLNLDIKASSDIILNTGAEDSVLDKSNSKGEVKIVNKMKEGIVITTHNNENKTVGAGETVIFEGNTTPLPAPTGGSGNSPIMINTISNISGIAKIDAELTSGILTPTGATVSYQWQICNSPDGTYANIIGATTNKYTPTVDNVGKYIRVVVTGTGNYTGTVTSAPTGAVASRQVTGTAINGVTAPVLGATPVTTATETTEYTASVTWSTNPVSFAAATIYIATITLTPKLGYTLTGVTENQFTVAGATTVSNLSNTGVITAVFPATSLNGEITVMGHRWINVTGLALGDVINVYDTIDSPDLLGTGTVTAGDPTSVFFPLYADLSDGAGSIFITVTSSGQSESVRVEKRYGAAALVGNISATLTECGTIINLASFQTNATGLEAAVSIDGTTYSSYSPITVDSIGNATITNLIGVSENTKVKIRVAGTDSTVPGDDKELVVHKVYNFDAATNTIIKYYPNGEQNLVIPTEIDGVAVKNIKQQAFEYCDNLKTVTVLDGVEKLEDLVFYNCANIETITIGKDVNSIGSDAVSGSASIIVDAANVNFLSEDGVLYNKTKTTLLSYPVRKADSSYSIPTGVQIIAEYAFRDNIYIQTVTIPFGVTTIGHWAFGNCDNLTNPVLPDSVTTIQYYAFANCINITSFTIPSSVTTIEDYAFSLCKNLTSAYFEGNAVSMGYGILNFANSDFTLYYHATNTGFDGTWCATLNKVQY
jgi:hypothetical protein